MPLATSWNSSSTVCCALHSSSVTYLHPDRRSLTFFGGGEGKRSFFVVLGEVVDDEVRPRLLSSPIEAFHNHGDQCFDVPLRVDTGVRSDGDCFTMAVIDGAITPTALDFGCVVVTPSMFASECDNGGVGGVADGGRDVTCRCHRECYVSLVLTNCTITIRRK